MCRYQETNCFGRGRFDPIIFNSCSAERVSAAVARRRVIITQLSPCLLRTHPTHPRSRDAKAALTHFSPGRHPPDYCPHISHTPVS
ncbi:hypothetical protein N7468_006248 [Penicillium chermesinum]|uniref:Uncharacterized protein n=1 Tax=Penicillium chermesinum TaxID=63820 RepID=A0A9W9NU54_9EURO|nr:uncharacterized protein N7468_006248 [Penicillium chermesinum]KAJ5225023.1 hypothetical protein N7468_006248 [Penicillium chermesinum]